MKTVRGYIIKWGLPTPSGDIAVRGETKVTPMPGLRTGEDDVGVWAEIDVLDGPVPGYDEETSIALSNPAQGGE